MATTRTGTGQRSLSPAKTRTTVQASLTDDGLLEQLTQIMHTDEFSMYLNNMDDIRQEFETHTTELRESLKQSSDNVLEYCSRTDERIARQGPRKWRRWVIEAIILAMMGGGAFLLVDNFNISNVEWAFLAFGALIVIGIMGGVNSESSSEAAIWMSELQQQQDSYRQELDTKLAEIVRKSITEVFRRTGIVHFPVNAPTLVELTTAKIVPSATQQTVTEFIRNHQSSAIGIAGPRGSGKSTLMQAIYDSGFASHSVLVPAPVRYDPIDFTRRLFSEIATEILSKARYPIDRPRRAQEQRILLLRAARSALTIGIAISATAVVFATIVKSVWHGHWADIAAATSLAGLIATLLSGGVLIAIYLEPIWNRENTTGGYDPSVYLASEALDMLTWDTQQATKETSTVKLVGGLLTLGGEDSMTRSRRESSLPDLVDSFRKLEGYSGGCVKVQGDYC